MSKINLLALGGMDEKNKSLFTLEIDSKIYIIDAGIYEPLRDDFGIQHFIPRIDFLDLNRDKLKGIFISSLNRQQFGTLQEIMRVLPNLDIYASDVTIFSIKQYYESSSNWKFHELKPNQELSFGSQIVLPFLVPSSMPGTLGFKFKTNDGNIFYLSDYTITPIPEFNLKPINEIFKDFANEKNLLLISDSLNASKPNELGNNFRIRKYIEDTLVKNKRRTIVSVYEDEIINLIEIIELANQSNRDVYFIDKNIFYLVNYIFEKNYCKKYKINLLSENIETNENSIIIATGSRTDLYTKLKAILISEDKIKIKNTDIVFLASPPQPGNEHVYAEIANNLSVIDPLIVETNLREKLSIHPTRLDFKKVLEILKPKFIMPFRGYYKEFLSSAILAKEMGYEPKSILIAENGEVFTLENGVSQGITRKIKEIGNYIIQSATEFGIELDVITHRETLASEGVVTLSFIIDKTTKEIKSNIDIQMKGVIWMKTQDVLLEEISNKIKEVIEELKKEEWFATKTEARINKEVTKILKANIKKAPFMIIRMFEI